MSSQARTLITALVAGSITMIGLGAPVPAVLVGCVLASGLVVLRERRRV